MLENDECQLTCTIPGTQYRYCLVLPLSEVWWNDAWWRDGKKCWRGVSPGAQLCSCRLRTFAINDTTIHKHTITCAKQ